MVCYVRWHCITFLDIGKAHRSAVESLRCAQVTPRKGKHMLYPNEAERNMASIDAVPLAVLPIGPAPDPPMLIAAPGRVCYCYPSGGAAAGTRCVWRQALLCHRTPGFHT